MDGFHLNRESTHLWISPTGYYRHSEGNDQREDEARGSASAKEYNRTSTMLEVQRSYTIVENVQNREREGFNLDQTGRGKRSKDKGINN